MRELLDDGTGFAGEGGKFDRAYSIHAFQWKANGILRGDALDACGSDGDAQTGSDETQDRKPVRGFLHNLRPKALGFAESERLVIRVSSRAARVVDEWIVTQTSRGNALLAGAGMVGREHGDERFSVDSRCVEIGIKTAGIAKQSGIEGAILQTVDDFGGEGFVQVQAHFWKSRSVTPEDGRQRGQHGRADEADVQRADLAAAYALRLFDVALDVAQGAPGAFEKCGTGSRQGDGTRGAVEERVAEHLFQLANLLRERRLGKMQAQSRAAEVQFFSNRDKVTKVTKLNVRIHTWRVLNQHNKILDILHRPGQTGVGGSFKMAQTMDERQIDIEIRELEIGGDGAAFRALNEEWIERHFTLEAKDRETLNDPENAILRKGGRIYQVHSEGAVVGCVALIPMGGGIFELSKMAVSPSMRGRGIGRKLLEHTIAAARALGATGLFLGSNSILKDAVHLYEALGFRHVPPEKLPEMQYARANVFMEMTL